MRTAREFWRMVDRSGKCWIWLGGLDRDGYGQVNWMDWTRRAHHIALLVSKKEIPTKGYECHHSCRNRRCVRPAHLRIVTHSKNNSLSKREHCPKGHLYVGTNIGWCSRKDGSRYRRCLECHKLESRERYARQNGRRKKRREA